MSNLTSIVKMKSLGRRFGTSRKAEKERLLSEPSEQNVMMPNYQTQASFDRTGSVRGCNPDLLTESTLQSPSSATAAQRPVSPTAVRYAAQTAATRHGSKSSSSSSPPLTPLPPTSVELDVDFDQVPFQFYRLVAETWKSPVIQAAAVVLLCLLLPSPVLVLAIVVNEIRSCYKPRKKKKERRIFLAVMTFFLVLVVGKDTLFVKLLLSAYYQEPASTYDVGYTLPILFWILLGIVLPVCAYSLAKPKYVFGCGIARKGSVIEAFPILSAQATTIQVRKEEEVDKIANAQYKGLLAITNEREELDYVTKSTPIRMFSTTIALASIVCVVHCLPPAIFQLKDCVSCRRTNATTSHSGKSVSFSSAVYLLMIGATGLSTLLLFALLAAAFVYVTFCKVAILNEWLNFNKIESDSKKTLIASGPGGIAMWWKIRQLLVFLMDSTCSLSALLGHVMTLCSTIYIVCTSVYIFLAFRTSSQIDTHRVILIMIDNSLFCIALLIVGLLTWLSHRQKAIAGDLLRLKQLNVAYELGRLMNLDQDTIQQEPQVRVSIRVLRGCLMLLQELTPALDRLDDKAPIILHAGCACFSLVALVCSSFVVSTAR